MALDYNENAFPPLGGITYEEEDYYGNRYNEDSSTGEGGAWTRDTTCVKL